MLTRGAEYSLSRIRVCCSFLPWLYVTARLTAMAAAPASSPARCSVDPSAVPSSSRFTVLQQRSDASSAAAMVRRGARWRRWCGGSAGDGGSFRCCCCAELRWRRERARNRLRGGVVVAGRGAAMVELLLQRWRAKLDGDGGGVVQIPAKCCRFVAAGARWFK